MHLERLKIKEFRNRCSRHNVFCDSFDWDKDLIKMRSDFCFSSPILLPAIGLKYASPLWSRAFSNDFRDKRHHDTGPDTMIPHLLARKMRLFRDSRQTNMNKLRPSFFAVIATCLSLHFVRNSNSYSYILNGSMAIHSFEVVKVTDFSLPSQLRSFNIREESPKALIRLLISLMNNLAWDNWQVSKINQTSLGSG